MLPAATAPSTSRPQCFMQPQHPPQAGHSASCSHSTLHKQATVLHAAHCVRSSSLWDIGSSGNRLLTPFARPDPNTGALQLLLYIATSTRTDAHTGTRMDSVSHRPLTRMHPKQMTKLLKTSAAHFYRTRLTSPQNQHMYLLCC